MTHDVFWFESMGVSQVLSSRGWNMPCPSVYKLGTPVSLTCCGKCHQRITTHILESKEDA